ncbi:hypothetical protein [Pontibacter sp. G13]|uniref:hypothetical protein n=1 Tax=Pontibacter sp. G13 TaxID=3074898 RepID=UPI0028892557|nr:hypothetical protein [Pontibacter sp. G13]WNJ17237.1 hypothetical protein RJD25_20470 [Pontibacter sp. G13]
MKFSIATFAAILLVPFFQSTNAIQEDDFQLLLGNKWYGSLTYLDYQSQEEVTLASTVSAEGFDKNPRKGLLTFEYPDEPSANYQEDIHVNGSGTKLNGQLVVNRRQLSDGTIRIYTEDEGKDNDKRAIFYYTYEFSETEFSIIKEVQYTDGSPRFIRNKYSFTR